MGLAGGGQLIQAQAKRWRAAGEAARHFPFHGGVDGASGAGECGGEFEGEGGVIGGVAAGLFEEFEGEAGFDEGGQAEAGRCFAGGGTDGIEPDGAFGLPGVNLEQGDHGEQRGGGSEEAGVSLGEEPAGGAAEKEQRKRGVGGGAGGDGGVVDKQGGRHEPEQRAGQPEARSGFEAPEAVDEGDEDGGGESNGEGGGS